MPPWNPPLSWPAIVAVANSAPLWQFIAAVAVVLGIVLWHVAWRIHRENDALWDAYEIEREAHHKAQEQLDTYQANVLEILQRQQDQEVAGHAP